MKRTLIGSLLAATVAFSMLGLMAGCGGAGEKNTAGVATEGNPANMAPDMQKQYMEKMKGGGGPGGMPGGAPGGIPGGR